MGSLPREATLIEVDDDRVSGGNTGLFGQTLQVGAETFACVLRDLGVGGQQLSWSLNDDQGVAHSDEHVGHRIKVSRRLLDGRAETMELISDQGHTRFHDCAGRARQHRQLLAGFNVQLSKSQRMTLHGPDGLGESGQRPLGERGSGLAGLIKCGVEQCRELTDDGGFEEIVLARPTTVDRHVRHAGVTRDEFDSRPFEAEVPEHADRSVEDFGSGWVGLLLWHSTALPRRDGVDSRSLTMQFRGVDAAEFALIEPCSASYYRSAPLPEPGRCRRELEPEVGRPFPQVADHGRHRLASRST